MRGKEGASVKSNGVVLAIETGSGRGGIALLTGDEVLTVNEGEIEVSRSEDILGILRNCLAAVGRDVGEIERIVVSTGPGSLTGLRIGRATARGLSDSLGVPLSEVSAFEAMIGLSGADVTRTHFVLLSGNKFYVAVREDDRRAIREQSGRLAAFGEWLGNEADVERLVIRDIDWEVIAEMVPDMANVLGGRLERLGGSLAAMLAGTVLRNGRAFDNNEV